MQKSPAQRKPDGRITAASATNVQMSMISVDSRSRLLETVRQSLDSRRGQALPGGRVPLTCFPGVRARKGLGDLGTRADGAATGQLSPRSGGCEAWGRRAGLCRGVEGVRGSVLRLILEMRRALKGRVGVHRCHWASCLWPWGSWTETQMHGMRYCSRRVEPGTLQKGVAHMADAS